jgi:hypothetical protein
LADIVNNLPPSVVWEAVHSHSHLIQEASLRLLDFRTCSWDDEAVDLVQTCPGITRYEELFEEGDEVYKDDDIELLPPLADFDVRLPF